MKPDVLKLNRIELKLFYLLITFFLFFGTAASSANAKVINWEISPEISKNGDMLIINGLASPEEEVEVSISFEKTVPVYLKEFTYEFENIEIINFNNLFTVRAEGVENLEVKMKTILSKTENTWADNGIATISCSEISPGKYKVRVEGMAEDEASSVNLRITTVQKLKAGEDGKFRFIYKTESFPSEKLEVRVGDLEREILLDSKEKVPVLMDVSASSEVQVSGDSEDRKTSKLMALTSDVSTGQGSTGREKEEKRSIYLTESSLDENNTMASTSGEVPSKEVAKEQKNQKPDHQITNLFYLFAGVLGGFGCLLVTRRKK
ncbi:hypothetical protein SDC9_55370 [bioreactor metagenome]|uniref:Uncharacterized protein n=1 Tax=bioreactor metagenome TaxID=1076179 RepID=A0A644X4J0_9ZZZZ